MYAVLHAITSECQRTKQERGGERERARERDCVCVWNNSTPIALSSRTSNLCKTLEVKLKPDGGTKGFAYATFQSVEDATNALLALAQPTASLHLSRAFLEIP